MRDMIAYRNAQKRQWKMIGLWFGTIVLLGVLKRVYDRQHREAE